jgi:phage terminase large subunit-like protein
MFSNVIKKTGKSGGNVKYAYPTKQTDDLKIDGAVATIMNIARIMVPNEDSDSYNARARAGIDEILRVL